MLRYIALFALVAAASAGGMYKKCPKAFGMYPFDLQKFTGEWHLVAANHGSQEIQQYKCAKMMFNFLKKDDQYKDSVEISARYNGINYKDNTPLAYEAFSTPVYTEKAADFFSVIRTEGTSTYSAPFKQTIIASDYATYALMVGCKPTFDATTKKFDRYMYAGIWSRQGVTLSKDTIDTLISVLSAYDVEPATMKFVEGKC